MKKIAVFIFCAVLLLPFAIPCFSLEGDAQISLEAPNEEIISGKEFSLAVMMRENAGFTALSFGVEYDAEAFSFVSAELCEVLDGTFSGSGCENGNVIIAAASDKRVENDGLLAKIYFVPKNSGDFDFSLTDTIYSRGIDEPLGFTVGGASILVLPSKDGETENEKEKESKEKKDEENGGEKEHTVIIPETKDEETEKTEHGFEDTVGHWSEEYVARAAKYGLIKGYSPSLFGPDDNITRVQFAAILYRLAGSPTVTSDIPFTDMSFEIPEFIDAVAYGYEKGYISGVSETQFCPNDPITRSAAMKMLYGACENKDIGYKMFEAFYRSAFNDSEDIPDWAKDAMFWGIYNGLVSGTGDMTLSPNAYATRAQIAKILVQYVEKIEKRI